MGASEKASIETPTMIGFTVDAFHAQKPSMKGEMMSHAPSTVFTHRAGRQAIATSAITATPMPT